METPDLVSGSSIEIWRLLPYPLWSLKSPLHSMFSLLRLALLSLAASASFVKVTRDVEPAEEAMREIVDELTTLSVDIIQLTPKNITASKEIDNQFVRVTDLTSNATLSILACVGTEGVATNADALTMLVIAQDEFQPTLFDVLNRTANAASIFFDEAFAGTIHNDLIKYNTSNAAYLRALISGTPPALLPNATAIENEVTAAFNRAIGAFASASTTTSASVSATSSTSAQSSTSSATTSTSRITLTSATAHPSSATGTQTTSA
ncbi:hypothetical protein B0H10DRAFT_2000043 [Mycena sp. CBHHK59/15]|nr:hypothetical protein B0H10DRAFT_2000043 [Mycena sp. CBHHK59/15]